MTENMGIVIVTVVGICAMTAVACFCIKIMLNTARCAKCKK